MMIEKMLLKLTQWANELYFLVWFSLQEGSYLLSHAAEDSSLLIYKTSDGKVTRTAYNLHKTHCSLPGVPSSLSVPWVPLDPSLLLPYHIHHGRIPCTFPPKSLGPTPQQKVRSFWQLNVPLGGLSVSLIVQYFNILSTFATLITISF